ncbi:hypothetical protein [Streptomyces scabiei]|uniref:hypothetical protein n=1 Tax=Streptomyces scabiei TaxID=1930 RepID=UPI0029B65E1F|nr:hypothetical protein [Streptomyces scabiei]MDX2800188.1 hypothetical protein [Streptomyces scabiei]MDX3126957.1 hypothetical protein [Streptomyces scabiei]
MTVHVTMLVSSLPEGAPHDDRAIEYKDADGTKYTYVLHNSGALVIHRRNSDGNSAEVIYGSAAWESVQGDAGSGW